MKKNFSLLLVMLLGCITSVFADTKVYIEDFAIAPGATKTVDVFVESDGVASAAVSADFILPEGLTAVNTEKNKVFNIVAEAMMKASSVRETGALALSLVSAEIPAGVQKIATLDLAAAENFEGGAITVTNQRVVTAKPADVTVNVKAQTYFQITSALNGELEAGAEAEVLSYMFTINASAPVAAQGEGHITLADAEGNLVGGAGYPYLYEPTTEVNVRFTFDTDDHQLHTPGVYTLTVPAGALVAADGAINEEFTASWTVVEPEQPVINIETVEVGTVLDNAWGSNDYYYTATVKFQKPAGAKYAYCEGLHMDLDGENTGVPFSCGNWGMVELGDEDEVTIVFKDNMVAVTDDPDYEGDIRAEGSYVGQFEMYFMDENYLELATVAKFTGSVVLPHVFEMGTPDLSINALAEEGPIALNDLMANGLSVVFNGGVGYTPDMTVGAVVSLSQIAPGFGFGNDPEGIDPGFAAPTFVEVLPATNYDGDCMFGTPSVPLTEILQYISEAGAGAYMVDIKYAYAKDGEGNTIATWTPGEVPAGGVFEVYEPLTIENVTAEVTADANEWGDVHFGVTVTVPADELAGLEGYMAYTEGVKFTEYLEDEPWIQYFTFMPKAELVEIAAEEDLVFVCPDAMVAKSSDPDFDGEIRQTGEYEATCVIALMDAFGKQVGTATFNGVLNLSEELANTTGVKANFNVTNVTVKYNVAGQRVNNAKGIVIENGKKYIQK